MYRTLDVRRLEHHDRPPLIMKELSDFGNSESLVLITEIKPIPIMSMLEQKGYECKVKEMHDGSWKVFIGRKNK